MRLVPGHDPAWSRRPELGHWWSRPKGLGVALASSRPFLIFLLKSFYKVHDFLYFLLVTDHLQSSSTNKLSGPSRVIRFDRRQAMIEGEDLKSKDQSLQNLLTVI